MYFENQERDCYCENLIKLPLDGCKRFLFRNSDMEAQANI